MLLKGRIASIIFFICFWRDFSSAVAERLLVGTVAVMNGFLLAGAFLTGAFLTGARDRLVAAARPGSRLGSLVRFRRTGSFRFGAGIISSDQLGDLI